MVAHDGAALKGLAGPTRSGMCADLGFAAEPYKGRGDFGAIQG